MKPAIAHRDVKPANRERVELGDGVVAFLPDETDPQVDAAIDAWLLSLLDSRKHSGQQG